MRYFGVQQRTRHDLGIIQESVNNQDIFLPDFMMLEDNYKEEPAIDESDAGVVSVEDEPQVMRRTTVIWPLVRQ